MLTHDFGNPSKVKWVATFVISGVLLFFSLGSAQSQSFSSNCKYRTVEKYVTSRPLGAVCEEARQGLFKRCIMAGGADEFTKNCYDHLRLDDHPKIKADTFEFREALFRVCGKMSGGSSCCQHLQKEEQGKLRVCGYENSGSYKPPLDRCPAGNSFCSSGD